MKIKQIYILDADEHVNTFYSFQMYVNEILKKFYTDKSVSEIKIEYATPTCVVFSYLLEVDEEEVE